MPIPTPRNNEPQREFISRCYDMVKDEYEGTSGFAICYTKWREKQVMKIARLRRKKD